jgi:hypothetical protein
VTYEELRDNLYDVVAFRRAKANAFSINQTVENVGAGTYNNSFDTAFPVADGAALISAVHVNTTGGTYSNALTPAAALSEPAIEDLIIQIMGVQMDRNLQINLMPVCLNIPRQEYYNAHRILNSTLQSGTANNDIIVLRVTNAFPSGIKLNHYFTSSSRWWIRTNCPYGMQMFWRDRPIFDKDNDYDTKNAKAGTYMRFSVGNTDPRGIFGSNAP